MATVGTLALSVCLSVWWRKELDGGDPELEDNRALISTAVRTCKTAGG